MPLEDMQAVYVIVTGEFSDPEDEGVQGIYEVAVPGSLRGGSMREAVLDQFHDHVGIGVLDDFEITVVDGDGNPLEVLENYNNGSLGHLADYRGGIDPEDAPAAVANLFADRAAVSKP